MRIKTISRICGKVTHFVSAGRFKRRKDTPIRLSGAGVLLNVDNVSQTSYLGPMYEDDLGRGPWGVSYTSAESASPSV